MVFFCVFITITSPLCCRYVLSTLGDKEEHMKDGGPLGLDISPMGHWPQDFTFIEIALLFVLVMGNFANIAKWIGLLSGYPNSPMNGLQVELEGHIVIGTCTPILGENDAVFLRSLLGRHAAAFHTVLGRHDIEGLYIDIFANEQRSRTEKNVRLNQWCAWIEFIQFMAELPIEEMKWVSNPCAAESRSSSRDPFENHQNKTPVSPRQMKKMERLGKGNPLLSLKSFSADDFADDLLKHVNKEFNEIDAREAQIPYATNRCIRISKTDRCMYETTASYEFQGVNIMPMPGKKLSDTKMKMATGNTPSYMGTPSGHMSSPISPTMAMIESGGKDSMDLLPMMTFLDNWLERVKANDSERNNNDNKNALQDIFNSAPVTQFFEGNLQVAVQNRLRELYTVFAKETEYKVDDRKFINLTGPRMHEYLCHRDELTECVWKVKRKGMKDWDLVFSFISRGKLVKGTGVENPNDAQIVMDNTQIIRNSIVYYEEDEEPLHIWLENRKYGTFRVIRDNGSSVDIMPWPTRAADEENPEHGESTKGGVVKGVKKSDLHLFCGQRGKAGALHFAMDYLRKRGHGWCQGLAQPPLNRVKTIFSVIDARHMITEPHVYFNNALPHFARGYENEDIKGYAPAQDVYLVQYPQYYADVKDNVWNARNAIHWTISQFVQDYGRCCVSTGSNSLWDISPKGFDFLPLAGSCRVDDTAATLSHIKTKIIVHMPVFVSMGVSRPKVNDMLDTWTRWAAGNVELSWILLTSKYVREYMWCHTIYVIYMVANFLPSSLAYVAWLILVIGIWLWSFKEQKEGRLPFRDLCSILKYWECATFSVDRITQVIPVYAILLNIALYQQIPMLGTASRALFWVLWVCCVRIPTLYMMDKTIEMLRVFNTKTSKDKFKFSEAIWDAMVFETAAQPLGFLAFMEGSYQGLSAALFNRDITFWAATGVKKDEVTKKYRAVMDHPSKCSGDFWWNVLIYTDVRIRSFYTAMRSPRMCVTAYCAFVQVTVIFLMGYIFVVTDDRTNLLCAFLAFFFNMALFATPSTRLLTPYRWFWSFDYNFEYYFLPLSLLLICFIAPKVHIFQEMISWFKAF